MQILWVSPTPSHPQNAGNRAHIHALGQQLLAAGHSITFLLYDQEGQGSSPENVAAMRSFWTDVSIVPHRLRDRNRSLGDLWGIDDWFNKDLASAIHVLSLQKTFDVVFCEYVFLSQALTFFGPNTLKILNCHDRMSDRAELLDRNGLSPDFFYTSREQEKIALDRADLILAIQDEERAFFQALTSKCVIELGHPAEENFVPCRDHVSGPLRVGYIGSVNALNRKSVQLLAQEISHRPLLEKNIQLVLAGSICNVADMLDVSNVECLGFVENEADFFSQIDLFINPMVDGTGLKIKTLSTLCHGVPFLGTQSASAGLPTAEPEHQCADIGTLVDHLETVSVHPHTLHELRDAGMQVMSAYQKQFQSQIDGLLRAIATKSVKHLRRQRVLLVTDIPFWEPGVGNNSRILALIQRLRLSFDCYVFFFGSIWREREDAIKHAGLGNCVISFKPYETTAQSFSSRIAPTEGLKRARSDVFGRALKNYLSQTTPFDAIIYEYIWTAYLIDAVPYGLLPIIDTHDFMAPREYRFASQGLSSGLSISIQEEISILKNFGIILAIQEQEAKWMQSLVPQSIVLCCPHGIPALGKRPPQKKSGVDTVIFGFVGGGSRENQIAISWFIREIWPVINSFPVALHVYGNVCDSLQSIPLADNIHLKGKLPSLSAAYAHCDVMINPIMHGGGLKIKSIEALAHGKPLISSPEGAAGIPFPEQNGILVVKTRTEFITAALSVIHSPEMRKKMADQALTAAKKNFDPEISFAPLIELIRSL